jgi:hypothetical protein
MSSVVETSLALMVGRRAYFARNDKVVFEMTT